MFSFLSRPVLSIVRASAAMRVNLGSIALIVPAVVVLTASAAPAQQHATTPATPSLDYAFFKERVQPILLKKRPGHARCVTCHEHGSPPLQPLASGATTWNEEQSRQNFEVWKLFVVFGEPLKSPLLIHPLAREAGGDRFHAGGKHWKSQDNPEWQTLAAWVNGKTAGGSQ